MQSRVRKLLSSFFRVFKPAHSKVADFRKGRTRQPDDEFVAECSVANTPESRRIALGVRRAIAGIGLVDPLFIRASDRFPEELSLLPLWDSMDWLAFIFELEDELDERVHVPDSLYEWSFQNSFCVRQLVVWLEKELESSPK
jgi:hypothetical protein